MRTHQTLALFVISLILFPISATPLEWVSWHSAPKVALTFDDGPHPEPTAKLCDILARYQVPATFFVVGKIAVKYPQVLRDLSNAGHEISNHTWSHFDVKLLSPIVMKKELDQTRVLIQSITGQRTFLFRTPGGTESYLRRSFKIPAGYQLVLWDVHSLDQEGLSAEAIARRVLSQVKNGDVVLMHNGLSSTRAALEIIIPDLKRRGYEFVTVSQMIKERPRSVAFLRRSAALQG